MNLDQMDLTALQTLQHQLEALDRAGRALIEAGLTPTFAVSSWTPALTVPPLGAAVQEISRLAETRRPSEPPRICKDGPDFNRPSDIIDAGTANQLALIGSHTEPTPPTSSPAVVALPEASPPASSQEEPEQKPSAAPQLAAGDAPAASNPPALIEDEPARPLRAPGYTDEETAWAIKTFVSMIEAGSLQEASIKTIALKLNRSVDGIKNRIYTGWKRGIQEERDRRAAERAKPVAVSPPIQTAAPTEPKAMPVDQPRSIYEDELVQRISTMKMPHGWGYGADQRMLLLATGGVDAATIAVSLEVSPKAVKARLDQLTYGGRYHLADVLQAVTAILTEQKKGVAA